MIRGLGIQGRQPVKANEIVQRPVVGILGNHYLIDGSYPVHATGTMNSAAIANVAGAIPLMVPSDPALVKVDDLMEVCHGFLFTGGRPNVHPEEYGEEPTEAHGAFDRNRDKTVLPLIRRCVDRGQPVFGLCRGFQEFNVAFGGTLHPEIRELPGRMNHRMPPEGSLDEKFAHRHSIEFAEGSIFAKLFGSCSVIVNSLHGQGIKVAGDRVSIEGLAPDGTPEAIAIEDAPGFALAVQWHPEYRAQTDPVSRALFGAFGDALRAWQRMQAGQNR